MAEYQDPPLRLTIQGLRWDGDDWSDYHADDPVPFSMSSTDTEGDARTALQSLRRIAVQRLDMILFTLNAARDQLDFDAPNWPTRDDLSRLVDKAERITDAVRVLRELAPEIMDDDDDPSPEPEPHPAAALSPPAEGGQ